MTAPIAAGGLGLDIGGALLLASSFILKKPGQIYLETASFYGGNPQLLISTAKQKAEAEVAGVLLTLGFIGQLTWPIGWLPDWAHLYWTLPVAVAADVASWLFVRHTWRMNRVQETVAAALDASLLERFRNAAATPDESSQPRAAVIEWLPTVEDWARNLEVGYSADDSYEAIARKTIGARRWERLIADKTVPADLLERRP